MAKRKLCRQSGKVKYDTHERALIRGGRTLLGIRGRATASAYTCPHCKHWHLTTQEQFYERRNKTPGVLPQGATEEKSGQPAETTWRLNGVTGKPEPIKKSKAKKLLTEWDGANIPDLIL